MCLGAPLAAICYHLVIHQTRAVILWRDKNTDNWVVICRENGQNQGIMQETRRSIIELREIYLKEA